MQSETEPQKDPSGPWSARLRWTAATLLLVGFAVLQARRSSSNPNEPVGRVLGAVAVGLLIALVLRFVFLRLAKRRRPVWSPALLALAAGVLLFASLGNVTRAVSHQRQVARHIQQRCGSTTRATFGELPAGLSYAAADPRVERAARERFAAISPAEYPLAVRAVRSNGRAVGVVLAIPIAEGAGDVRKGFLERARETGTAAKERDVEGGHVLQATTSGGVTLLQVLPCEVFITVGADEASADRVRAAAMPR